MIFVFLCLAYWISSFLSPTLVLVTEPLALSTNWNYVLVTRRPLSNWIYVYLYIYMCIFLYKTWRLVLLWCLFVFSIFLLFRVSCHTVFFKTIFWIEPKIVIIFITNCFQKCKSIERRVDNKHPWTYHLDLTNVIIFQISFRWLFKEMSTLFGVKESGLRGLLGGPGSLEYRQLLPMAENK